jgi:hypothetical protein
LGVRILLPPELGRVVSFPVGEEIAGGAGEAICIDFLPLSLSVKVLENETALPELGGARAKMALTTTFM